MSIGVDNELVRRVARRVFERSDSIRNYVMLEGLIRRFLQLNPDADPEAVDWTAVWDDTLTYEELIQAFREQYPMYRWEDRKIDEETYQLQKNDRIKDVAVEVINQIEIEDFDKLIQELQRLREEALEDIRRIEGEPTPPQPAEHPTPPPKPETPPVEEVRLPQPSGVKVTLHLLAKYPFLRDGLPLLRAYSLSNTPHEVRRRAVERVLEAVERGERCVLPRLDNPWLELLSFPYSRALMLYIGDDWLRRRWSLAEASRVERLLHSESDDILLHIASDLKLQLEGRWVMHFTHYLQLTKRLKSEPRFKLVNRLVRGGFVSLTRPEVIRLVREALYNDYSQTKTVPPGWESEEAKAIRSALQKRLAETIPPAPSREWPPCMVALRNQVADASHFGLFALAAYMSQKGHTVDEIVEAMKARADFDPRIARYQVEHIAGMRGSRIKYSPPKCSTMQTHGLCIENGRLCGGIKNPLQFRRQT